MDRERGGSVGEGCACASGAATPSGSPVSMDFSAEISDEMNCVGEEDGFNGVHGHANSGIQIVANCNVASSYI